MEPFEITARELVIRPWRPEDAPEVHRACQDPAIQQWTTVPSPYRMSDAVGYVTEVAPTTLAEDRGAHLGVFDAAALRALCAWGFTGLGLSRIEWRAQSDGGEPGTPGNLASHRVAEKVGFQVEGVLRAGLARRTGRYDVWVGVVLPTTLTG